MNNLVEQYYKMVDHARVDFKVITGCSIPPIPMFTYLKTNLNCFTFKVPKIKSWVEDQCFNKVVLNLFGGPTRLNNCVEISNDLAYETIPKKGKKPEKIDTTYHMDALDLCKYLIKHPEIIQVILIDAPYSYRKSMEFYKGYKASRMKQVYDLLPEILAPNGTVISFGYHASQMGKLRGFYVDEILIIDHSGAMHTTIATVEKRIK
jgi:hypothetical protein